MIVSLLTKLEASRQAASYNEQRVAAHVNIEYCYLHYHSAFHKGISEKGALCSIHCEDFGEYGDPILIGSKNLYPNTLAMVMAAYQKPIADAQKEFMTTLP